MFSKNTFSLVLVLIAIVSFCNSKEIAKLPYCNENYVPRLVLVSTIDGKFSAINDDGNLSWQINTEPGPLLKSNIHNLELTKNGGWVRIIPSLTGTLYRFDGNTIDQIPISAEKLLKSSFKFTDNLVIAGGYEVRTYGVGFKSGTIFYTCSSSKCDNKTNELPLEDVLLIERNTQTVRAIESHSGNEKWNFSVGHHNIKLPQVTCITSSSKPSIWNISAIMPDGLLLASSFQNNVKIDWQYQFSSPIVRVWKWDGSQLTEVNLFSVKTGVSKSTSPTIYMGMHKKQLYIHEASNHHSTDSQDGITEEGNVIKRIPWKPIPASNLLGDVDPTDVSEYVNGQGYYFYAEIIKPKENRLDQNNFTIRIPSLIQDHSSFSLYYQACRYWKEILVFLISIMLARYIFSSYYHHNQPKQVIFVDRIEEKASNDKPTESSTVPFNSRFMNDFETLRCLGKGGFGVVFEVKQKIDECHYAIKRIILPSEDTERDAVMREVKALAKLEHNNIVRYFNSWVETPPFGWQDEHDSQWVEKDEKSYISSYTSPSESLKNISNYDKGDSFIVFSENTSENTNDDNTHEIKITDYNECNNESCNLIETSKTKSINKNNKPVFLYIQMQLCQRQSLKEWLIENSSRNKDSILNIFKQIVSAVEYVHLQGLIHRDLKPSNIFFSMDGQIKVGDFGLVKEVSENYDHPNTFNSSKGHTKEVGTRLYMSPEQEKGKNYNYKVDIYSLGLIFFELLVHFSTDMERICTLNSVRNGKYPKDFIKNYPDEHTLLTMMLCYLPEKRLTTFGIRSRPPINDEIENSSYEFELPKISKPLLKQGTIER